jgi:beta-glucosidase-like glycosyl hydrolase
MKTRYGFAVAALCLTLAACSGGGGGGGDNDPECRTHEQCPGGDYCNAEQVCEALADGVCNKATDCSGSETCVANACETSGGASCNAPVAALTARQPTIQVAAASGKTAKTATKTFAHPDDASVQCSAQISYKDLNGNGQIDPYEDWTLTAAERAADLVGRMSAAEKVALLAHGVSTDAPTPSNTAVSTGFKAMITAGIRFAETSVNTAQLSPRATWANNVQAECEKTTLGVPFVLSMQPAHSAGNGRVRARGFSQWPAELSLAASGSTAVLEKFGEVVSKEYRAIGVRMAISPSADLLTDPRWFQGQFTFGEDAALVADLAAAYVKGLQGTTLGSTSVAAVVGHFPCAGPAKDGWDDRLAKGKYLSYPGKKFDVHEGAFGKVLAGGVAGVMPAYGIVERGDWTAVGGLVDGNTIEQVGASFNAKLLTDVLRTHHGFGGLVVAPAGVLENAGTSPLGAPWGMESANRTERIAKGVAAGVDQFAGVSDVAPLAAASDAGAITTAQIEASAKRALSLAFQLGLFENPYVDPAKAPQIANSDTSYQAGLDAMNRGMVLLVNKDKPAGWLNHDGNGTQVGDKGNAGNGSLKVLPAPPGEPYVSAGCDYFVAGDFDLDYVRSVSAGYGNLTNDSPNVKGVDIDTNAADGGAAQRMALSDYVFIRVAAPFASDPDSGVLDLPLQTLVYGPDAATALDAIAKARAAITASATSKAQIVVGVDAGRTSVLSEVLAYNPSGLYVQWNGTMPANGYADKVFLDVAFGIVNGVGKLPAALPASDAAAASQSPDVAGDGADTTFVAGHGLSTPMF